MIRVRRPAVALAAALALGSALAGCTGSTPDHTRSPTPKPTPLYSSDTKALGQVRDSWARYIDASNQVGHDGWSDFGPLARVATGDALKADTAAGESNRAKGLHVEGDSTGRVVRLERIDSSAVTAYTCVDFSATRIIDASGQDRTSPNRTPVLPYETKFVKQAGNLVVGRIDLWSGDTFC